jgi:hypothetical protein
MSISLYFTNFSPGKIYSICLRSDCDSNSIHLVPKLAKIVGWIVQMRQGKIVPVPILVVIVGVDLEDAKVNVKVRP